MALDKIAIGIRIRKIREEIFEESRDKFGKRCDLTERHIGQLERGDFLVGLNSLDNIVSATGIDVDYILYGKDENNKLHIRETLHNIVDRSVLGGYLRKNCLFLIVFLPHLAQKNN